MNTTDEERMIFRNMKPAEKLELAAQLHMQAREWKKAALRVQHSDWTTDQIAQRTREIFLYGSG